MGNEIFEEIKRKYKKSNKYMLYVSYEDIGTLLNLIEKQIKEIEELKTEKAKRSWVHIKENGEVEPLFYVSEDKIKAKIEEVEQWELYNMKIPKLSTLDERLGAKIGIKYVLQSLLERRIYEIKR